MSLGLAHSLSRYKLKFSPDKVDTMIVQAISLLDDLDKELNNYSMRCREWYGWHFPELGKIITDNLAFVRTVELMGTRDHAKTMDLSDVLPEEVEEKGKEAAEISMGTEISEEDIINIKHLCQQVVEIQEYRGQLYEYLKNRMMAIAIIRFFRYSYSWPRYSWISTTCWHRCLMLMMSSSLISVPMLISAASFTFSSTSSGSTSDKSMV